MGMQPVNPNQINNQQMGSKMNGQQAVPKKIPGKVKLVVIAVLAIAIIAMFKAADNHQKEKEKAALDTLNNVRNNASQVEASTESEQLSESELKQRALIEVLGEPPQGFRWSDDGTPVPVSDENLTDEDVAWQYLRSLTMLDMESAQKYAYYSTIINRYSSYFGVDASQSYYIQFQRKLFTKALLSLQIDKLDTKSIFADGKRVCTFTVTIVDLSYKDFWVENKDAFFTELESYFASEKDATKGQQYVYDKILEYYDREDCVTKTTQVDIVLDKVTKGGWLVTDDTELEMLCEYTNGTSVYSYIMDEYAKWIDEKYSATSSY